MLQQQRKLKYQQNLKRSLCSGEEFKDSVKETIEEIHKILGQITISSKMYIELIQKLKESKEQYKTINEDNFKMKYKIEKIEIRSEEYDKRIKVFEDISNKNQLRNEDLMKKVQTLEEQIKKENILDLFLDAEDQPNQDNDIDSEYDCFNSRISEISSQSNTSFQFKEISKKKMQRTVKAKNIQMQDQFHTLIKQYQRNKIEENSFADQYHACKRKNLILKDKICRIDQEIADMRTFQEYSQEFSQENVTNNVIKRDQKEKKLTLEENLQKIQQRFNDLVRENEALDKEINKQREYICFLEQNMGNLVILDKKMEIGKMQTLVLWKEIKKEKSTQCLMRQFLKE